MTRLLLVDNQAAFREPLAVGLESYGFDVAQADSATQALNTLASFHPQVLVVDIVLPTIDGFEFIKYLRSRGHYRNLPVILLSAFSDQTNIVKAAKLKIRDYLLKSSFSLPDLIQRIQAYSSEPLPLLFTPPSSVAPGLSSEESHPGSDGDSREQLPHFSMREFLDGIALHALKPHAARVLELCCNPEVTLSDIEEELKLSASLVAKVLQIANSAAYNRGAPVHNLINAIAVMGITNLRNIASGAVIQEGFLGGLAEEDAWRAWQASLACARLMGKLNDPEIGPFPGSGYMLGLCANLVPMLVSQFLGDHYRLVRDWSEDHRRSFFETFEVLFSGSIEAIYWEALRKVGLPEPLAMALSEYAGFAAGTIATSPSRTTRALDAIVQECRGMGFAMLPSLPIRPITREDLRTIPALGSIPFQIEGVREDVMVRSFDFTRDSKAMRHVLERPLFTNQSGLHVALYCDSWVVPDGPIHLFLGGISDVATVDRERLAEAGWKGIVLVSDAPREILPTGAPGGVPLLVLHRTPLEIDELPFGPNVSHLRLPCAMSELAHIVQSF